MGRSFRNATAEPIEDYGVSAADGAACRAMATALAAIQAERRRACPTP